MVGLMEIFSTEQLLKLENHQYHCQGLSVIEAILDPYWKRFVTKLPRWLSPNALTLTGLLSIIIPSSLLVYYSYQGITEVRKLCVQIVRHLGKIILFIRHQHIPIYSPVFLVKITDFIPLLTEI